MESIRKMKPAGSPREVVSGAEKTMERVPSNVYLLATLASIGVSAYLYLSGRKWAALFVGLWAPTIINYGVFNKLLRPSQEIAPQGQM